MKPKTVDGSPAEKPLAPPPPLIKAPEGTKAVDVPAEFIIYRCKISKGRVLEIPLPPDFTQADVKRLHAFLLTQVDDDVSE
jgi:hypothetical protein